jgi:hypothetical protein
MGGVMGGATAGVDEGRTVLTVALVRAASSSCEMTPNVGE